MRNVVLLTYDSLRADHCGHLGYERETTPAIDELAADGVTYENAIAPASRTNPSMAGILTGEPMVVRDEVADPRHSRYHLRRHGTIAERLQARGYATGAFCPNAYASKYYGFDRGFETFEDFLFSSERYRDLFERHLGNSTIATLLRNMRNFLRREEAFRSWESYVDDVVGWAEAQESPFFLWVFSLDTHFPYLSPREYRQDSHFIDQYYYNWRANRLIDRTDVDLSDRERQHLSNIYDDSIRYGDALLATLRERLSAFDPVFVVHADHGEAFDERGVYGHFYPSLYEENIHVPLVIGGDGVPDRRVVAPKSLADIHDVVHSVASESVPTPYRGDDWVFATDYDGRRDRNLLAVRTRNWKGHQTIQDGQITDALYDLGQDPGERENLVEQSPRISRALKSLITRRRQHENELMLIREAVANRV